MLSAGARWSNRARTDPAPRSGRAIPPVLALSRVQSVRRHLSQPAGNDSGTAPRYFQRPLWAECKTPRPKRRDRRRAIAIDRQAEIGSVFDAAAYAGRGSPPIDQRNDHKNDHEPTPVVLHGTTTQRFPFRTEIAGVTEGIPPDSSFGIDLEALRRRGEPDSHRGVSNEHQGYQSCLHLPGGLQADPKHASAPGIACCTFTRLCVPALVTPPPS